MTGWLFSEAPQLDIPFLLENNSPAGMGEGEAGRSSLPEDTAGMAEAAKTSS